MPEYELVWTGHVRVERVDGKLQIVYAADGAPGNSVYLPDGYFENKAVKGLADKLKKAGA